MAFCKNVKTNEVPDSAAHSWSWIILLRESEPTQFMESSEFYVTKNFLRMFTSSSKKKGKTFATKSSQMNVYWVACQSSRFITKSNYDKRISILFVKFVSTLLHYEFPFLLSPFFCVKFTSIFILLKTFISIFLKRINNFFVSAAHSNN